MTMRILELTDYAAIKAQVGVTDKDITDKDLDMLGITDELKMDLLEWFPNYAQLVADTSGDALVDRQCLSLSVYAKTYCAYQVMLIAPMKFLQKRANGDNQASRFSNKDALENHRDSLLEKAMDIKSKVLEMSTAYSPAAVATTSYFPSMSIATPAVNKITGE